jgi:hypothetical protein
MVLRAVRDAIMIDGHIEENPLHVLHITQNSTKLHGLSPRANYTDRATAAGRQS